MRVKVLCPRLQRLYLNGIPELKAGPIIRLVKARLRDAMDSACGEGTGNNSNLGSTNDDDQPHDQSSALIAASLDDASRVFPIEVVELNDCPKVDPEALPWLRSKVPIVSCKPRKEVKRRR
jgi:F-box/TPR repeat protein Pof3